MFLRCKPLSIARVFLSPAVHYRPIPCSFSASTHSFFPSNPVVKEDGDLQSKDVVLHFTEWFKSSKDPLLDRIFEILAPKGDDGVSRRLADQALSQLGLPLSEKFVLGVLNYGKDVLSCLKFFDWAGRQPGFYHTRATFHAIFKVLSGAKLMSLMLDFLETFLKDRYFHRVRFYDTLVMGYAIAGKPDMALQVFGKMRFLGLDLDVMAYHVLLNALVEENCFDAVDVISKQITLRGYDCEITSNIMVKSFCKQDRIEEAEEFVRELLSKRGALSGYAVRSLVDTFCKQNKLEMAGKLVEESWKSGKIAMELVYSIWIRCLVESGKLCEAMEFLRIKKISEGYVPNMFRYNFLICRLLRENRLEEVFDLLMEMKEGRISPDDVTMNAALCFFCKAGMVDVALELYNLREEIGMSPNSMAYNYLINTLCGDGSIDEAYQVLKDSIERGYFPGKKTFSIIADALCRERKMDKMKELIIAALDRNFMPSDAIYDKFISALCEERRVEDGYLIHRELNRLNKTTKKYAYFDLIHGFSKLNRGDLASRLLVEMQENGHIPTRNLFNAVVRCLFYMDNPEMQFLKLLEMMLSRQEPDCKLYNCFIEGAGRAKRPDMSREVYNLMLRRGIEPNLNSDILMLQSYLKNQRISDALNFFNDVSMRRETGRKLYNNMIVGLSRVNKPDLAFEFLRENKDKGLIPSIECYEELLKSLCANKNYDTVVMLIEDLQKSGRPISPFIGNILLLHSLRTRELYETWIHSGNFCREAPQPGSLRLVELVGAFSGHSRMNEHIENWEHIIKQCFPLDTFTYNMMLRRLSMTSMDDACELFKRMWEKGYEPNRWTYDILVHGFFKHGRMEEAKIWLKEMTRKGFYPTERTIRFI